MKRRNINRKHLLEPNKIFWNSSFFTMLHQHFRLKACPVFEVPDNNNVLCIFHIITSVVMSVLLVFHSVFVLLLRFIMRLLIPILFALLLVFVGVCKKEKNLCASWFRFGLWLWLHGIWKPRISGRQKAN